MSRIRRRTSGNAHASEGDRVPKRTHAHTFAHVYLHIFRTWALDTLVARGKKRGEEKSRFLQKLNVFMQWNRGNNCEVLTIRVKRWKDWGHKCHVGLIVGEFRKSFFLSFSFTLSGPTTPCQALLREYPWRLVLSSIAWYFWSWVSFAEPKHSSLSYNSIKKKGYDWILSLMWQLKSKTNYSDKYIHGNHRNCILYDVRRGVVTQNYLLLWWRTQWRDFRTNTN